MIVPVSINRIGYRNATFTSGCGELAIRLIEGSQFGIGGKVDKLLSFLVNFQFDPEYP